MRQKNKKVKDYSLVVETISKFMSRLCVLLLTVLILIQALYTIEPLNSLFNKSYKLEGSSINYLLSSVEKGEIKLSLEKKINDYNSYIIILVNGEVHSQFSKETASISVKDGDIIELQGKNLDKPVKIKISYASDNIIYPEEGKTIILSNKIELISRVKLYK